jgi:hypothetical protein
MKLEFKIKSDIDKMAIKQAIYQFGKDVVKETSEVIVNESKNYLTETDRVHTDPDSLFANFVVEEPVITDNAIIGKVWNHSPHAGVQEFGRSRPYPLTITEELQQKYEWAKKFEIGAIVWTYMKAPTIPPGVEVINKERKRGAHPFMAVGLIRAYKWLQRTYCQQR